MLEQYKDIIDRHPKKISNQVIFGLIFSKTTLSLTFEIHFLLGYNGRNEFLRGIE